MIYVKNVKILQNFYRLFLSKLLENSFHFDVPKACNLAYLLEIVINGIEGELAFSVSKRLQKDSHLPFLGKLLLKNFLPRVNIFWEPSSQVRILFATLNHQSSMFETDPSVNFANAVY